MSSNSDRAGLKNRRLRGSTFTVRFFTAAVILLCLTWAGGAVWIGSKTIPVSRPPADSILIVSQRTGGIAGLDDRLVIFNNGAAIVSTRTGSREIVFNATDIERISALFVKANFQNLQENYPAHRGSDLFQYTISYNNKTVSLEETAFPDTVMPVIDEMDRIVAKSGA